MTTRRRSSVSATVKKSTIAPKVTSTKYNQPIEIKKVTETPTPDKKVRPDAPNISWTEYQSDFKVRWEIHSYEVDELIADVKKGYAIASPYVKQAIDYTLKTYKNLQARFATVD